MTWPLQTGMRVEGCSPAHSPKLSLALALFGVLSDTFAGAGADVATATTSRGRIVVQSSRDGGEDIYAMTRTKPASHS